MILTGAIFTAAIFTGFLRPGFVRPDFQGFFGERSEPTHFVGGFHGRVLYSAVFTVFSRPRFLRPRFFCVFGRILERPNPFHAALWGFLVGMAGGVPFCAVSTSMAQKFGARFLGVFGSLPENFSRSSNVAVQELPVFDRI